MWLVYTTFACSKQCLKLLIADEDIDGDKGKDAGDKGGEGKDGGDKGVEGKDARHKSSEGLG